MTMQDPTPSPRGNADEDVVPYPSEVHEIRPAKALRRSQANAMAVL